MTRTVPRRSSFWIAHSETKPAPRPTSTAEMIDDGVEIHRDMKVFQTQASTTKSEFHDVAGAGAAFAHQQRDLRESPQRYGSLWRPLIAADDQHHAIFKNALAEDLPAGCRPFDDAEIDGAPADSGEDVFSVAADQRQFDTRMQLPKRSQHAGKNVLRDGEGSPDAQCSGGLASGNVESRHRFLSQAGPFARKRKQRHAGLGETYPPFPAVKERYTEFGFQRLNLLAHGWLAQVQALRRAPKARFVGNRAKDLQPEILHGRGSYCTWFHGVDPSTVGG